MGKMINTKQVDIGDTSEKSVIAITGAGGFIGRRLVEALLSREDVVIRALVRSPDHAFRSHPSLTVIAGDLARIDTLSDFLVPGSVVINLAHDFSSTSAENIRSAKNLIQVCKDYHVKRLIHCSTASVFGRVKQDILNEEITCNPISEYGITKLLIEKLILEGAYGNFELINLRPTSVFGSGGAALKKLIDDLRGRSIFLNYLNSCLFNRRKLNLVSVDTVVAAILFFLDRNQDVVEQTFIVSEDDEVINNFDYVEQYLFQEIYGKKYALRPIRIPFVVLSAILRIMGRDNINPRRIFDSGKLRKLGFKPPHPLDFSLRSFARGVVERHDLDDNSRQSRRRTN